MRRSTREGSVLERTKIVTRAELKGGHVHISFWMGPEHGTRPKIGELVVDDGDDGVLVALLILGCEKAMGLVYEHDGSAADREREGRRIRQDARKRFREFWDDDTLESE